MAGRRSLTDCRLNRTVADHRLDLELSIFRFLRGRGRRLTPNGDSGDGTPLKVNCP